MIFGIEVRSGDAAALRGKLLKELKRPGGPEILEHGRVKNGFGPNSLTWFAYWKSQADYEIWCDNSAVESLFDDTALLNGDIGLWREYCRVSLDHNETSFSRDEDITGLVHLSDEIGITQNHAYWGSCRDRLVAAVDNDLNAQSQRKDIAAGQTLGKRIKIEAANNVCLIKTSQDMSNMNDEQNAIYTNNVEPALHAGLNYIRDNSVDTGCIGMRFIEERTEGGDDGQRTIGLGYFASLKHLEEWTHNSATHNEIMKQFMGMVEQFQGEPGLGLWHEVTVFPSGWLTGDYVNCSPDGTLMQSAAL